MSRELLQQALDALEAALSDDQPYIERGKAAIAALREALAQPEPEPEFCEGQWWLAELDAMAANGTDNQKRAVYGVVRRLMAQANATPPAAPAPAVREPQEHVGWCRYVTAHEKATRLVLCDSDAPGAFRVYREPSHHD